MSIPAYELPAPTVANLETLAELNASLEAKGTYDPGEGLYPRDGTASTTDVEAILAVATIPEQRLNIIWASGMSAVRESVNYAAIAMARQTRGGDRPAIAYGEDLYGQSIVFFRNEKLKGVNTFSFDSGDATKLDFVIDEEKADVIFAETVANTPNMPVLDIAYLLAKVRGMDNPPIVVLDNTLPLSTGLDFDMLLQPDDRVIVVESGTKNLMNNSDTLGIAYSKNEALMDALRKYKAHSGAVNSLGGLARIAANLNATTPGFHDRNRAVFRSTEMIALALQEAKDELGESSDFLVEFPANARHPNAELAGTMRADRGEFGFPSPVVFITAKIMSETASEDLIDRLSNHSAIREQIEAGQIHLGQSFGLPAARLLYDVNAPNVRFAGGFDLADEVALASAIKEAAADK